MSKQPAKNKIEELKKAGKVFTESGQRRKYVLSVRT